MPGVEAFVDHRDIPGKNDALLDYPQSYEQIFTTGRVFYAGQAIGLILADSIDNARKAAQVVKVTYKNLQKPILSIREALQRAPENVKQYGDSFKSGNIQEVRKQNGIKTVEGEFEVNTQYHFYMETQSIVVRPGEKGQIDVTASTQWLDQTQRMIAQVSKQNFKRQLSQLICRLSRQPD